MAAEILSETPISTSYLGEQLKKIKQRDKELNFRATKTEEHLDRVDNKKDSKELFEKITKLNITRLREQHIYKIIDIMPTSVRDLTVIMQGYTLSLNNENLKKIVDVINKS
jgi:DNA-directed RNA polymerase subunit F